MEKAEKLRRSTPRSDAWRALEEARDIEWGEVGEGAEYSSETARNREIPRLSCKLQRWSG